MEIRRITKMGNQKMITIPKKSYLQIGDYVMIKKIIIKENDKKTV